MSEPRAVYTTERLGNAGPVQGRCSTEADCQQFLRDLRAADARYQRASELRLQAIRAASAAADLVRVLAAECARLRPVVDAAQAWQHADTAGRVIATSSALEDAVQAYEEAQVE